MKPSQIKEAEAQDSYKLFANVAVIENSLAQRTNCSGHLGVQPKDPVMVGNTLQMDIQGGLKVGLKPSLDKQE